MSDKTLLSLFATVLLFGSWVSGAWGQNHHPFHKDFYLHWRQPGNPNMSCCNARIERDGVETGDCEPTQARVRNGRWEAWIRQIPGWVPVPDNKIIREKNPNTFDGHACWTPAQGIICFAPPDTGG